MYKESSQIYYFPERILHQIRIDIHFRLRYREPIVLFLERTGLSIWYAQNRASGSFLSSLNLEPK